MENSPSNLVSGQVSMKSLALVLAKLAPSNPISFSSNGITKQVLPFFKFLRALGQCPILFENIEDMQGCRQVNYEFRPCWDLKFILSALAAVFIIICTILGAIHSQSEVIDISFLNELWPHATNRQKPSSDSLGILTKLILLSFEIVYTLVTMMEYCIAWLTSQTLSTWLNEWNSIERDMHDCPGMVYSISLSKFWKYFAIPYIIIPTIALGGPILTSEWDGISPVGIIIILIFSFVATACLQTQDVKVVLLFQAIEMSFHQIRQTIKLRYDMETPFHKKINSLGKEEIRIWQRILFRIRKQAHTAGRYMAVPQLTSIATNIFFASAALFVAANLIGEQPGNKELLLVVIFTLVSFIRVIIKIYMAVRITEEERRIANLLKHLELVEDDEECRNELKGIFEMLVHCPTEISLNNYVKLNNSLILGICGQVLTQFIVFQQFQSSK